MRVFALFLMFTSLTCYGQSDSAQYELSDTSTWGWIHTTYAYTDAGGKRVIIQNSLPKGDLFTDESGNEYAKATYWTRIINETDNPLELTIDFSGDSYEAPGYVGASVNKNYKIILSADTLTRDKLDLYNYGLIDVKSFLANSMGKPSSLKRKISPKTSDGFYVMGLLMKPNSDLPIVKTDGTGVTRAGLSIKDHNLFWTLNGKTIQCGKVNLHLK